MKIYESAEDYLETILMLKNRLGVVRSIDIVNELGYSKPSVSIAMKKLRENALITVDASGHIELTDEGRSIADGIYERHKFFTDVLTRIGVNPDVAKDDACKLEHHLSDESFAKLKDFFTKHTF
ncbi:MAG: metal-dependent transcriptional regulator [Eubacteriales bacterium]